MSAKKAPPPRSASAQARAAQQQSRRRDGLALLGGLDCLRGVPEPEIARLLDLSSFRAIGAGATVLGPRENGRFLFLVLSGSIELRLRDKDSQEVLMGVLSRGDCLGEGPLFGDFFRRIFARAQSDCYLIQTPLADLRKIFVGMPALAAELRRVYKRRMVECTLARVPMLAQLLPIERLALAEMLQPLTVARGELIMRQGEPADSLYLIESGQVVVEQSGLTLATLGEGDFFGEMSLMTSQPHRADVRAITPTELLVLPGAEFHRLLAAQPELEAQMRRVVERRIRNTSTLQSDDARARQLELAVDHGLFRGTHLLVRDPALCPAGCRICEQACAERHGSQRLWLSGATIDGQDVLRHCRQCGVGAECVEACPVEAFERAEDGTLRITEACTGCGACVEACPYDVVQSVPLRSGRGLGGPLGDLLEGLRRSLRPRHTIALEPARPARRADKCDFCAGHRDMACLSACPTGSLRLVPVQDLFPL